jgi:large subunit ribosomal protein L40e
MTLLAVSLVGDTRQAACLILLVTEGDEGLLSPPDRGVAPEAFLNHAGLALHMARFPEAERRRLHKMICMQCYARNAPRATRCRKCGSTELRPKAKEARKE